jgi:hypothetical protein
MSTASSAVSSQRYCERRPRPEFAGILSCVWIQEVSAEGPTYEHRTVPNGCSEIACVLGTGIVRVAGARRGPALARHSPGARVVGVRFCPAVAPGILGLPAWQVVDVDLELDRLRSLLRAAAPSPPPGQPCDRLVAWPRCSWPMWR